MSNQASRSVAVSIEDLHLAFAANEVLKGIELAIEPGEFFAFLGPSGSGKSTLLRAIAGFGPRPRGRILIDGEDVVALPPWRRDVGMVFQSYALWPHMSVWRNVAFGLEERRLARDEIRRRVDAALERVGLLGLAERRPAQLSGGQQQRVALARTLVVEPRVLLLDEPLSNLDANLRVQVRRELRELQRDLGLTTIFVTHDQEEANTTADRMAVLDDGVIQQVGAPIELYDRPANRFVATFLGTANLIEGRVAGRDGGTWFEAASGWQVALESAERGPRSLLFRPQDLAIEPADGDAAQGPGQMRGVVRHREFLGGFIRYAVTVGADTVLVDDQHLRGVPAIEPGTRVRLSLAADRAILLRE